MQRNYMNYTNYFSLFNQIYITNLTSIRIEDEQSRAALTLNPRLRHNVDICNEPTVKYETVAGNP